MSTLEQLNMRDLKECLTEEQQVAYSLGFEKCLEVIAQALRYVDHKVYRLPMEAEALEAELIGGVWDIIREEREEPPLMEVEKEDLNEAIN